jgi:hypothetical protein
LLKQCQSIQFWITRFTLEGMPMKLLMVVAFGWMGSLTAVANDVTVDSHDALRYAEASEQKLDEAAYYAKDAAERAARNGNYRRAQDLDAVADAAEDLHRDVNYEITRPLLAGESEFSVSRNYRELRRGISRLQQSERYASPLPRDIEESLRDAYWLLDELGEALENGRPGPGPGRGAWVGTCEVVLETIWGEDLQRFQGTGDGRTQSEAVANAQQDGMRQCQQHLNGGFTKCTVNRGNCVSERAFP